jgi:hypothetical protein
MQYADWITAVTTLLEYSANVTTASAAPNGALTPTNNQDFNNLIPRAIDYTENRLQRDLDLLSTVITVAGTMTANQRKQTLPTGSGTFIVCTEIRPIIGSVKQPPIEFVTRDFLDYAWPSDVSPGANIPPIQWSTNDQASILVGPSPDQAYAYEAVGTARLTQLSASAPSNFLTIQLPDLYVQCSMIFWFNFQQRDDSKQNAADAESQYQLLLKSATVEEIRKKFGNQFQSPSYPTGVKAA